MTQGRCKDCITFKERSHISQNFEELEQGSKKFFSNLNLQVKDNQLIESNHECRMRDTSSNKCHLTIIEDGFISSHVLPNLLIFKYNKYKHNKTHEMSQETQQNGNC